MERRQVRWAHVAQVRVFSERAGPSATFGRQQLVVSSYTRVPGRKPIAAIAIAVTR
jgi:hypothetical protein